MSSGALLHTSGEGEGGKGQLSLLVAAGWEMSSSLRATG